MTVLDRLKMELSNQQYFSDEQYTQFLLENKLTATDDYDKSFMYRQMLFAVLDILEAVSNDTDLMMSITTEFTTTSAAAKWLEKRIEQVKDKIASLPDDEEEYSCFSLMYTREDRRNWSPARWGKNRITSADIDEMLDN
ncbi:MAG: hypothetical protein LUD12_03620 [Lachnospiraceae bacterium]|nr:hypothetical protein [Lachnospiraceae bacterium]